MSIGLEITIIVALIVANGVFAMAEIAIVAARKTRLRKLAETGDARARAALELASAPNRFLSTVQIGITLIGVLAGAFGGATLAEEIARGLDGVRTLQAHSEWVSVAIVVAGITFLSLVIGELVPKRIGLNNPEEIARLLAGPMNRLSGVARPVIAVLSAVTDGVLKLLGVRPKPEQPVSEDEVRTLIEQGLRAGVFHRTEQELVNRVFQLDELTVHDLRTPRARIVWLKLQDGPEANWRKIVTSGHSWFPVYEGNRDNVIGIVSVKALAANLALTGSADLKNLLTQPLYVPFSMNATRLLELFKQSRKHVALITDEFGSVEGLVTVTDVMEAIVGEVPSADAPRKELIKLRDDGSWLCDAWVEIEHLRRRIGVRSLPGEGEEEFQTLGGFVLHQFGRIPSEGDHFDYAGLRFEVIDMDRHRIDKVLIKPSDSSPQSKPAV